MNIFGGVGVLGGCDEVGVGELGGGGAGEDGVEGSHNGEEDPSTADDEEGTMSD